MLKAQEMNKEMGTQQRQPTVIAKLMGLDALPAQHSVSVVGKTTPKNNTHNVYTIGKAINEHHQQGNINSGRMTPPNSRNFNSQVYEKKEFKDVHEVQKQYTRNNDTRSGPLSMGKYNGFPYEKRMTLVHKKFMEAKRLARNENLLQSREFQDALEVLSSNRDLFLRFLEEPNPWFSKHWQEMQPSPPTHRKCITVLKPSKVMAKHVEEQRQRDDLYVEANVVNKLRQQKTDAITHPTRIVVLKPNLGRSYDTKDEVSFPSSSQRFPESDHTCGELSEKEARCSREVAKEITRKMQERLGIYRRDEILLSSALSTRYEDGGISMDRSSNKCMEEEWGDSFSRNKTLRHSWDQTDRCLSPCSFSSLCRASYSPESSGVSEAKKHLSDRWVMVASNGINQKPSRICSFNTLGKMLAIPEAKKERSGDTPVFCGRTCNGEHDQRRNHVEIGETSSAKSWQISRSIRASEDDKSSVSNKTNIPKAAKSLLKGKISSLFSSRNKEFTGCHPPSPSAKALDKDQPREIDSGAKRSNDLTQCIVDTPEGPQHNYEDILKKNFCSTPEQYHLEQGTPSAKEALALEMKRLSENTAESMEHPSPVSVLEATFEEEEANSGSSVPSKTINSECFRVVSRIPSSESVACSLPWEEDDLVDTHNLNCLLNSPVDAKEEDWLIFVRKLLSSSGFGNETSIALATRLYSLDGPLDPALLDKYMEPKREGAKSRQKRSNQRLVFDCVNFVLLEIIRDELSDNLPIAYINEANENMVALSLTEKVVMQLKEWFSIDGEGIFGCGENVSLMIDTVVSKQVRGMEWEETTRFEIVEMGREIERHVLDDLVTEMLD